MCGELYAAITLKIQSADRIFVFLSADKTAITLTPPTVGRPSANLSADDRPIYRPIKCQILALFSSANKNKIITTFL